MSAWWRRSRRSAADKVWAPSSWPGDAATVERWLRAEMLAELADSPDARIEGLDGIRTTVELDGADVSRLLIDATRVRLELRSADAKSSESVGAGSAGAESAGAESVGESVGEPAGAESAEPEIVARTPGILRFARLTANPVTVHGHDLHVDATMQDLPFDWVEYATPTTPDRPATAFGVEDAAEHGSPTGTFALRMRAADIGPLITDAMRPLLSEAGIRLRRVEVAVTSDQQELIAGGLASVRWKLFSATVRAAAILHVDPDAIVTVRKLQLSSRNPVVAIALRVVRGELRAIEGTATDLNGGSERLRIHDLRVTAAHDVAVTARIG